MVKSASLERSASVTAQGFESLSYCQEYTPADGAAPGLLIQVMEVRFLPGVPKFNGVVSVVVTRRIVIPLSPVRTRYDTPKYSSLV